MLKEVLLLSCIVTIALTAPAKNKVTVIGAGPSGLTAAKFLIENGYDVTVLEARSRVGGRIWSSEDLGYIVDLGAAWIHDIDKNIVYKLAEKYSVKTKEFDYDNCDLKSTEFSHTELKKSYDNLENLKKNLNDFIETDYKKSNQDKPLSTPIESFFETNSKKWLNKLSESDVAVLKQDIAANIEGPIGDNIKNLSTRDYLKDENDDNSKEPKDHLIENGYISVFKPFMENMQIKLNQKVISIEKTEKEDKYIVTTSSNEKYSSDAILVTVPLGVLKQNQIKFIPDLHANVKKAIQKLGMGVLEKLVIEFSDNFWGETYNMINFVEKDTVPWLNAFNIQMVTHKPTLVFLIPGNGKYLPEIYDDNAKQKIVDKCISYLKKIYGEKIPIIEKNSYLTNWKHDEFSFGSYSTIPVDADSGLRNEFTNDNNFKEMSKLFFAGEHTDFKHPSSVYGAYRSGYFAAERIVKSLDNRENSFYDFLNLEKKNKKFKKLKKLKKLKKMMKK